MDSAPVSVLHNCYIMVTGSVLQERKKERQNRTRTRTPVTYTLHGSFVTPMTYGFAPTPEGAEVLGFHSYMSKLVMTCSHGSCPAVHAVPSLVGPCVFSVAIHPLMAVPPSGKQAA